MKKRVGDILQKIGIGLGFVGLSSVTVTTIIIMIMIVGGFLLLGKAFGGTYLNDLFASSDNDA